MSQPFRIKQITTNNSKADSNYFDNITENIEYKSEVVSNPKVNIKDGQNQYTWSNGNYYIGEFKDGLKHGYGLWVKSKDDPNSNQYRGEFLNDKK